jgi:2-polyprenyl-3-methyl-5-hydroxy-6-metoxy-1,4-benzoquinol methylase
MESVMEKLDPSGSRAAPPLNYTKCRMEIAPLLPSHIDTVLEIGCGAGETMGWLRSLRPVRYAAAVELSTEAGTVARSVFDDVEINDIALAKMTFDTDRFDLILALDVLEHLTDPDQTLRALRDRLKPTGVIILSLPNVAHYDVAIPLLFRGRWDYADEGLLDRTHLRFFTKKTALHMVENSGLVVGQLNYNHRYPSIFHPFGLRDQKWRWYSHRIMHHVLVWPSHLFNYQFLIAAHLP